MSTTPRGRSFHRRGRCKCAGGGNGDRAACCFNPLSFLFRCPGRGRSKHRQRTPSRVRDVTAPVGAGQEDEPSFFVYAMPNQGRGGDGTRGTSSHRRRQQKHRKPCVPSFGSCFRSKKDQKARAAATLTDRRPALTPATSLLTHPPGSPVHPEKSQPVTPSMTTTQPPSPAPTENNSSVVNSPAPPGRWSAATGHLSGTPRLGNQSTGSARSPLGQQAPDSERSTFAPQMQPSTTDSAWSPVAQRSRPPRTNVEGIEIAEVVTGERLSTRELGLIEMVGGSSTDSSSAESSVKSSLEYVNEPPPQRAAKQTVMEREAVKATEPPKLLLNGQTMDSRAGELFTETPRAAEAEELWAHDLACSRVHAAMLAETLHQKRYWKVHACHGPSPRWGSRSGSDFGVLLLPLGLGHRSQDEGQSNSGYWAAGEAMQW